MSYRTCDHLKEDGIYCSSPALTNQRYCYFHLNARARRVQAARIVPAALADPSADAA